MSYRKNIQISDGGGMVIASVHYSGKTDNGATYSRRCGLEFFNTYPLIRTIDDAARKAHEWADNHIKVCTLWEEV